LRLATPKVIVKYVDGTSAEGPFQYWPSMRSDGVDQVIIVVSNGETKIAGMTLYWLYEDVDGNWHRGGAALGPGYIGGNSNPMPPEIIIHPDETMSQSPLDWVPDMPHDVVKLGWWYPGTEGRPI